MNSELLTLEALTAQADSLTIHALKRACPLQSVSKALLNKDGSVRLESVQARRMGKLTLMPVYSTLRPDSFWGWRLSSINGYMISERLFQKATNSLRALWIAAQLFDSNLSESGDLLHVGSAEQQRQFHVLYGIYGN